MLSYSCVAFLELEDVSLANLLKIQSLLNWDIIIIFADCFSSCLLQSSKPVIRLPLTVSRIGKDNMNIQQLFFLVHQCSHPTFTLTKVWRHHRLLLLCKEEKIMSWQSSAFIFSSSHHHESEILKTLQPWEEKRNHRPRSCRFNHCSHLLAPPQPCRTAQHR